MEDGPRLAPMHRLHGPAGALFATFPQWPRINPMTDLEDRRVLRTCHRKIPPHTRLVYGVIHAAFGRAPINCFRVSHLGPDCGRVTTTLRCVVTRPLAHGKPARQAFGLSHRLQLRPRPVKKGRLLQCNNRPFYWRPSGAVSRVSRLPPGRMQANNYFFFFIS